jgi:hypothetical protein
MASKQFRIRQNNSALPRMMRRLMTPYLHSGHKHHNQHQDVSIRHRILYASFGYLFGRLLHALSHSAGFVSSLGGFDRLQNRLHVAKHQMI